MGVTRLSGVMKAPYRAVRRRKWKAQAAVAFDRYLAISHSPKLLHIGAGQNLLANWLNVDVLPFRAPGLLYVDATQPLPFPADSIDRVFSEHMIEHLSYEEAEYAITEVFRVLKPGGKVRLSTPDLETLSALYLTPRTPEQDAYIAAVMSAWHPTKTEYLPGFVINQLFDFGHMFLFDLATLRYVLQRNGFTAVQRVAPGQSEDTLFHDIDARTNDYTAFESLVVEALKP